MKPVRPKTPYKKGVRPKTSAKETVQVFCRVKPLVNDNDAQCLKVISSSTIQLVSPEALSTRVATYKEYHFTFKQVFVANDSQKRVFDTVALPLVENLIQGKNSLLFTYGVTGSGKTYTMNGEMEDGGIMPRCIDVIFNSISDYQANKYIFKPDKMNGFEVQTESEARLDRANSLSSVQNLRTLPKTPKKKEVSNQEGRIPDPTRVTGMDEDSTYAVFVTYIEVYNNYIYDLLENGDDRIRPMQNRVIRADANHNMYVHGIMELEVKSPEEAFEAFYKGQKRKKMAHTNLNSESSRSHSVFTIRLVQAPLDHQGESAVCDKKAVIVSQLSLVDLAGSERTNRTRNTGQRLREAGNINNSLMTLRTCLEVLRENQLQGTNKIVPYRDSRITQLFKTFFEGEGQVQVIVCVNPHTEDYDETLQVMKFAEMTQEVQVTKPHSERPQFDFTPGRRRANKIFKEAVRRIDENGPNDYMRPELDIGVIYSLGPPFPSLEMRDSNCGEILNNLIQYLGARMDRRPELVRDLSNKQDNFRHRIVDLEQQHILHKEETISLRASLESERNKTRVLEKKLSKLEGIMGTFQRETTEKENLMQDLHNELREKEFQLNQRKIENEKVRQKCTNKVAAESEKMNKELQEKLKVQKEELECEMRYKDEKLKRMKDLLEEVASSPSRRPANPAVPGTSGTPTVASTVSAFNSGMITPIHLAPAANKTPTTSVVRHAMHRRSRSLGTGRWLDHRSGMPTPLGTVLQPQMKKHKSVTKLTNVSDVVDPKVSKYCLMTQEQDSAGEMETRLYKADVVPTTSGGAQIIFNETETLKQTSPLGSPPRKRAAETPAEFPDVRTACSVSIEGHGKKPRI